MKTVLIDKSLVNVDFTDSESLTDKKAMFMYVCALAEAGASYVELDFESLMRLPKPSGAENYIYRLGTAEEYVVANTLAFSYAVVPLKYCYILPELKIPAILEIETGDSDIFDVLQLVSSNIDLSAFGMLRLIGDFEPEEIPSMISTYRTRLAVPLDLCPTNERMNALSSAIYACKSGNDAVTVCFGGDGRFASLEELLIMLSAVYKTIASPDYLEGICKCSLFSAMFSKVKETNLTKMMQKYMYRPSVIQTVDSEPDESDLETPRPRVSKKEERVRRSPAARVLGSLGIEREMSEQILKILEDCNMEIAGKTNNKDEDLL
jgi:hypothetical protein